MFPAESSTQDMLTASPPLNQLGEAKPEAPPPITPRGDAEAGFRRHSEAAMLHRNGRLRAIQALHRPNRP